MHLRWNRVGEKLLRNRQIMEFCVPMLSGEAEHVDLTLKQVRDGLDDLKKSVDGSLNYLTLRLSGLRLTDISALNGGFSHVQFIDISCNRITSLAALSCMTALRDIVCTE